MRVLPCHRLQTKSIGHHPDVVGFEMHTLTSLTPRHLVVGTLVDYTNTRWEWC